MGMMLTIRKPDPVAWIATHKNGEVLHFSKADGWKVEVVAESRENNNNKPTNLRHRKHNISER